MQPLSAAIGSMSGPHPGHDLIIRALKGKQLHKLASVQAHLSAERPGAASLASLTCFPSVSQETLIHLCPK